MKIKFKNGSTIQTLDEHNHKFTDIPMLLYSADISEPDSDNYSCINYYCSSCKKIVSACYIKNKNEDDPILPEYCPHCNVRFKGWTII